MPVDDPLERYNILLGHEMCHKVVCIRIRTFVMRNSCNKVVYIHIRMFVMRNSCYHIYISFCWLFTIQIDELFLLHLLMNLYLVGIYTMKC